MIHPKSQTKWKVLVRSVRKRAAGAGADERKTSTRKRRAVAFVHWLSHGTSIYDIHSRMYVSGPMPSVFKGKGQSIPRKFANIIHGGPLKPEGRERGRRKTDFCRTRNPHRQRGGLYRYRIENYTLRKRRHCAFDHCGDHFKGRGSCFDQGKEGESCLHFRLAA